MTDRHGGAVAVKKTMLLIEGKLEGLSVVVPPHAVSVAGAIDWSLPIEEIVSRYLRPMALAIKTLVEERAKAN